MMKLIFSLALFFLSIGVNAQTLFEKGFKDGFAKAYCYQKGKGCIPKAPRTAPKPNREESYSSYDDGYSRGFAAGLDYRRTEDNMGKTPGNTGGYGKIYQPDEYVNPIDLSLLQKVLDAKEKAFNQRGQQIDNLIAYLYALVDERIAPLHSKYAEEFRINISNYINYLNSTPTDLTDNNSFNRLYAFGKQIERNILDVSQKLRNPQINTYTQPQTNTYVEKRPTKKEIPVEAFGKEIWTAEYLIMLLNDIDFKPRTRGRNEEQFVAYLKTLSKSDIEELNILTATSCDKESTMYYAKWQKYYDTMSISKWEQSCKGYIILMLIDE
ncbi:MAG: hypothetical protein IT252_04315 [Chitinophagaceae bacterium]|nr:hypothetical protein [Chitinophagaceae bacterium]